MDGERNKEPLTFVYRNDLLPQLWICGRHCADGRNMSLIAGGVVGGLDGCWSVEFVDDVS